MSEDKENFQLYSLVEEVQTTLLRLELQADNIKYIRNVANGTLTEVTMEELSTVNTLTVGI